MSKIRGLIFCDIAVILILVGNIICDENEFRTVEVELEQGILSGKLEESFLKQKDYYAFRGIPFAQPPVGTLRFLPPQPYENWNGTYKAYVNKPTCLQFNAKNRNAEPIGLSGSEDCLYLSVFTPGLKGNYPVVVFDYNDNFRTGFNGTNTYSPDFFIEEDVIVVTISHRLRSLGYLTTQDDIIPGNNGLRDFILGLNWVKHNVQKFGGDNTRITLMGSNGGGSLVNMLMYSKQAKGLFSAVIIQSGCALQTAYFYENPRAKAFELGKVLKIETEDSKKLLEELQKLDAAELIRNEFEVNDRESMVKNHNAAQIFVPTLETANENSIITTLPEKGNIVNDVPVLIGFNSREGLDFAAQYIQEPRVFEEVMSGLTTIFPIRADFRFDLDSLVYNRDAVKEMNDVYYNDGYVHMNNILEYAAYLGDVLVGYAVDKTAKFLAKNLESSVYYYMFDFRGLINENSEYIARHCRSSIQHWGATASDEICYLHLCSRMKKTYDELNRLPSEQTEFKVLKKMVRLWTNFAKTRNPTPSNSDDLIRSMKWEPISKDKQEAKFLHITKKLKMKKEPLGLRAKFWDEFLSKYSAMAVDGVVTDKEGERYGSIPIESMRGEPDRQIETEEIKNNNEKKQDSKEYTHKQNQNTDQTNKYVKVTDDNKPNVSSIKIVNSYKDEL
ncbi:hypothetical protein O0L34_g7870 [Tuta absoluta]|nr:hypothetical protein O0L34_g7870 [Tuta absoluta]